jgi:hypothetical protein
MVTAAASVTTDIPAILKSLDEGKALPPKTIAAALRELSKALLKTEAERDGMVAKVEEYKARTRQAEIAHDMSTAKLAELASANAAADSGTKIDPPLPVPTRVPITQPVPAELVNRLIEAAVVAETNRCAKIASLGYAGGVNVDVWNRLTKTQNYQYLCLFLEYAIRSQTPPAVSIVK